MADLHKNFDDDLQQKLEQRTSSGLLRSLVFAGHKTDFSSNDYFGFSRMASLQSGHGMANVGATGSRSITGNSIEAIETEKT